MPKLTRTKVYAAQYTSIQLGKGFRMETVELHIKCYMLGTEYTLCLYPPPKPKNPQEN